MTRITHPPLAPVAFEPERVEGVREIFAQQIVFNTALGLRIADIAADRVQARIDHLRPGIGEAFVLEAEVLRLGARVASTHLAFVGTDGKLLAAGAGAYIVS